MKTLATIVVSSVLGFVVVFLCVPRREPEAVPPTWFELPGRPLAVDDQPVHTWAEVNEALRQATREHQSSNEFVQRLGARPIEIDGPRVRITWVPSGSRTGPGSSGAATATVRPFFPATVPWSRANHVDLVRYEVERPNSVD